MGLLLSFTNQEKAENHNHENQIHIHPRRHRRAGADSFRVVDGDWDAGAGCESASAQPGLGFLPGGDSRLTDCLPRQTGPPQGGLFLLLAKRAMTDG